MNVAEEADLDAILETIENPIRRKLIRRLSQEPSYQLQLSKELGFSQQLVAKHLETMEGTGVVASLMETSPHGPKRKEYLINRSISVSIDFAPNLFRAKVVAFDALPESPESPQARDMMPRVNEVLRNPSEAGKIGPLGSLLTEIDRKLGALEDERSVLLYLRHIAMMEVARAISGMQLPSDKKRIIYHVIDAHAHSVEEISKSLHLREDFVQDVLAEISKDLGV